MFNFSGGAASSSPSQPPPSEDKLAEDAATNKPAQNFVACVYKAKVADLCRGVTVTWSKNIMNYSLIIAVENNCDENYFTCKIDLKNWQFWGKKGLKTFKVEEKRVDVYWDFRSAKFSSTSPEPCSDYYIALVSNEELVLLIGDQKKEALKRTKARPSLVDAVLVRKKECMSAKKRFYTRAMVGQGKKEHEITIETTLSGPGDPEMCISLDDVVLIRVVNLHWRFRGNETVLVDGRPVQIFWDVHDWLYSSPNSGRGVFIFSPGETEGEPNSTEEVRASGGGGAGGDGSCDPLAGSLSTMGFCHCLYAWKIE